ncbi:thiosulfate sulfurtransferase GlpE [Stutzerimonas nitrititolerans]|uniref:thiosulfate sulfurtransferase GlpE n=1 Tax=Stutzerimonas nitrititolerans TaxID=2482751 RepID=UPI0028972DD6|nr:thiosulfate sulfurtransferase GlpE [Stutzerimonas nitrititolerans]
MSDFKRISAEQAQKLRNDGGVIVDIRDAHSFAEGHIPGSTHLDNHSLPDFIAAADLDQPLIVSCYHGHSSQSAAAYLAHQGFSDVYSLDGGFEGWRNQFPQDIERGQQ